MSPRKGGARVYLMNGMSREATQGRGGLKPPGDMDGVFIQAKSKEAVWEMCAVIFRVCARYGIEPFVTDLDHDVSLSDECLVGLERRSYARAWYRPFCQ